MFVLVPGPELTIIPFTGNKAQLDESSREYCVNGASGRRPASGQDQVSGCNAGP